MHTCIAYSSCIILTPCFAALIDSSGSFCVLETKGYRLVRTIPSPYSIATTHTVEKMERQEGKWFMNNLRAMIQDELKHALVGLIPLPITEITPAATTILPAPTTSLALTATLLPNVETPLANNDNAKETTFQCC